MVGVERVVAVSVFASSFLLSASSELQEVVLSSACRGCCLLVSVGVPGQTSLSSVQLGGVWVRSFFKCSRLPQRC